MTEQQLLEVFDTPEALALNQARLDHLDSLGFDFTGKVVFDVGCGVGHLSGFFLERGAKCVVAIDARAENVRATRRRFASQDRISITRRDVSTLHVFNGMIRPDVCLCYGLLYHLREPFEAIRNLAATGADLLLIESIVCDSPEPILVVERENPEVPNQSLTSYAARPSFVLLEELLLDAGFHLYLPLRVPDHPDFRWERLNNRETRRAGHNLRLIIIASRSVLDLHSNFLHIFLHTKNRREVVG